MGDEVGTGDGVRDVEFGIVLINGDRKVGVKGSMVMPYEHVVYGLDCFM